MSKVEFNDRVAIVTGQGPYLERYTPRVCAPGRKVVTALI